MSGLGSDGGGGAVMIQHKWAGLGSYSVRGINAFNEEQLYISLTFPITLI